MLIRTVFCALALCAAFAQGATCVWTGGSGSWSDPANWLDGTLPAAGDTVYVSNTVSDITLEIDSENISIASIRFEGAGPVTLTGNTLTLTGGFSFSSHTGWESNQKDFHISTFSLLAFSADVYCRVPLVFAPTSSSCGVCTATNTLHFYKSIEVQGEKTFCYHAGMYANPDDIAAGVPSKATYTKHIYFHDEVTGPSATIRPYQHPSGFVSFMKRVKAKKFNIAGWTNTQVFLYASGNEWDSTEVDYGNVMFPRVANALPSNIVFKLAGGTAAADNGTVNLGNFDTTINRLDDLATGLSMYTGATKGGQITSGSNYDGGGYPCPVTLTMKATADGTTTFMVQNSVSLVWDPVGDYTLTFTNRTSNTKGSIAVKRGKVRLTGNAAFPNVMDVSVAAGAKFAIESSAAVPLSPNALLQLGQGAKLCLGAGVSASVGMVIVGGQFVADGAYSGTGANAVDWIEGDGEVTVASSNIRVWKSAANGTWADSANWVGARVPDGTEKGVFICNDSSEDFTVSIASQIASFPTNFHIRNLGGGRTTLSVAANVSATRADISVGEGARVKVEEGARFYHATMEPTVFSSLPYNTRAFSPACTVMITSGGQWLNDGGETVFTNFYGTFVVKGTAEAPGRFDMRGGEVLFCDLESTWPMSVYGGGIVDLRDGTCRMPHHGYNHQPDLKLCGGTLFVSNTLISTVGKFPTANGGTFILSTGETVFDDNTTFELGGGIRVLRPNSSGETARFVMRNGAYFTLMNDYRTFLMGGTPGGKAVFDYECADSVNGRTIVVGDVVGEAELNVNQGLLRVHNCGLMVAGDSRQYTPSETGVVARANVAAGAAIYVRGSLDSGWNARTAISGLVVGGGNSKLAPKGSFKGEMLVSGIVTNDMGHVVVGWGLGDGLYVQNDGATYLRQNTNHQGHPMTAVGLGGGLGRVIVSNGLFSVTKGNVYVGGCPYKDVECFDNTSHTNMMWAPVNVPENNHDAEGTLTVVGGEFNANASTVMLGADGTGTIVMLGNAGTFSAKNLVLSNATSSVVRFVAGPGGFSPIGLTGNLAVTDGARIEVDLSDYTGSGSVFRLFNFASFNGDLDDVELVFVEKGGVSRKPCRLKRTASAIDFAVVNGTMVIFR